MQAAHKRQTKSLTKAGVLIGLISAVCVISPADAHNRKPSRDIVIERQGHFFVGGQYDNAANPTYMVGQTFVEYQIPAVNRGAKKKVPIIFAHGGVHSGVGWWGTPDGREGWADYFLRQGHPVYVIDQPGRGKSPWVEIGYGPLPVQRTPQYAEDMWSASEKAEPATQWPQAHLHTRWVGSGLIGDPYFDQYYAHILPGISGQEEWTVRGIVALLDKIGPAIILQHSQPGPAMWRIADQRPKLVKAMVAVEPSGPPFEGGRVYGPSEGVLTYSPPVTAPSQIVTVQQPQPDGPGLVACRLQAEPARQLVNLKKIPTLMLLAESSYHAPYDHCTAKMLKQAGVPVDFLRLADDLGIKGNGHLMLIEENSDQIAGIISRWITKKVPTGKH